MFGNVQNYPLRITLSNFGSLSSLIVNTFDPVKYYKSKMVMKEKI